MSILIIDDEEDTCRFLKSLLEESGYEAGYVTNALAAMVAIEKDRPDLILLDIRMPVVDGLELGYSLSNDPVLFDIPVIILSACADRKSKDWARLSGIYRFIEKPFSCGELLDSVQDALAHKEV